MNISELKIDPEFESIIPDLTDEEFRQLEENILDIGVLISPIVVWGDTVVDGHHRYRIVKKHPEIRFTVYNVYFDSREEAFAWICRNQLGRRNLTPEQIKYLIGRQYNEEKASHGGDRGTMHGENGRFVSSSPKGKKHPNDFTCEKIAKEHHVCKNTVLRSADFAKAVDKAEDIVPGTRAEVFKGELKPTYDEAKQIVSAPAEEVPGIIESIRCTGDKKKKPVTPEEKKEQKESIAAIKRIYEEMQRPKQSDDAKCFIGTLTGAVDMFIDSWNFNLKIYRGLISDPEVRNSYDGLLRKLKRYTDAVKEGVYVDENEDF